MEGTIYSLIPAVLMLVLVLLTRKVLLSLGTGIIVGALMLHNFNVLASIQEVGEVFLTIFYSVEDGWSIGSLYLLSFLLLLGITTAFMTASGGSKAFGDWAIRKVKTRRGAQLVPSFLGILIFIDDYFNSLSVGQVARPVTDRYKVSRAKLAYFIDSTSAPITVITPISSWGAYIIGTIGAIFVANGITEYQPLEAFVKMIPLNFYAFAAMLLVFFVAIFNINIGPMRKHETRAVDTGKLVDEEKGNVAGELKNNISAHEKGKIMHLLIPIGTLVIGTIVAMIVTGYMGSSEDATILTVFANTNVNLSLFVGGLLAVIIATLLYVFQSEPKTNFGTVYLEGIRSMLPAIYILILAWMIGSIISSLDTGGYLAEVVEKAAINVNYLPLILFLVAGFMALATGTSWGTFGIMLPIAAQIAVVSDVNLVLPAMAAVLAGSVFGDHCSPISDTTILSSTGAGANHIDHVLTQLPYAFISAFATGIGYWVFGLTGNVIIALPVTLVIIAIIASLLIMIMKNKND
ncbi:tetracycline efflux Na+/H+ antiporter family transporter Tet(35) [Paraliobacillus quinghaiensis]|uniref:Tetracycline efflux Na+/H+ antiporter family transporter Tet(35) n=1 Tax=Paraliobacillus quinghaiensis TaxID=470815 RepID=A0A917TTL6_9BACI|nr:Na+/H+ antiporter NhaC family protein [Paraliobacillus quinghaiensis]GGM37313.1 tetracycline efflux Na+/H+ antiporter family transporter Tet(35) [Paraliobacillus quinghaiensis]